MAGIQQFGAQTVLMTPDAVTQVATGVWTRAGRALDPAQLYRQYFWAAGTTGTILSITGRPGIARLTMFFESGTLAIQIRITVDGSVVYNAVPSGIGLGARGVFNRGGFVFVAAEDIALVSYNIPFATSFLAEVVIAAAGQSVAVDALAV